MNKIKSEDLGACGNATNNIPSKTAYMGGTHTQNEIYYFGNPPKKPSLLRDYLKGIKK